MRFRRPLVLSMAIASAVVGACVGSDPVPVTAPDEPDAGGGGVDGAPTDSASSGDTAAPSDGAVADAADGATGFDAGPPAWTSTLAAGTVSVLASGGDLLCTFEVVSVQTAVAPPAYQLFLRKQDAPAAVCNEPKGIRALGSGTTAPKTALLASQTTKRLVLAFSMKASLSGSSPEILRMTQVDWATGNDVHVALTKTKAILGMPVTPSLSVTQLFYGDPTEEAAGTVRLKGTGTFPGETGAGAFFNAMYIGFVGAAGGLPVAADTCVRSD